MGRALGIVDYDNVLPRGSTSGSDQQTAVRRLKEIVETIIHATNVSNVQIRLYGGWTTDGRMATDSASRAMFAAAEANPFPLPSAAGTVVHGDIVLATSLLSYPTYDLPDTYRRKLSPPRLRPSGPGSRPIGCNEAVKGCPAAVLARFTRKGSKVCPVDDCAVLCSEAFISAEQKMVDTHMVADILHASGDGDHDFIATVTGDTDIVPALLQSAVLETNCRLALMPVDDRMPAMFITLLEELGVEILGSGDEQ